MCGTLELPESNPLFALLHKKKWNQAAKEAHRGSAMFAKQMFNVGGFYDNKIAARINALQLACALEAPSNVIEALCNAYPDGMEEVDSSYQRNALHIAVLNGASPSTVQALLKLNPGVARARDVHGRLPIHYACKEDSNGEKNAFHLLKVFPEAAVVADINGFLPLHVACQFGTSVPVVRMLIRASPKSIHAKTKRGSTALMCAKKVKARDMQEELVGILERCAEETSDREMKVAAGQQYKSDDSTLSSSTASMSSLFSIESR
jgi:hypothetical protein